MDRFGWSEEVQTSKDVWKSVSVEGGVLSVTTNGTTPMPLSFVDSLATPHLVIILNNLVIIS